MKSRVVAGLCLIFVLLGGGRLFAVEDVEHLVIVSIDGMAAGYLDDSRAEIPTIRELAARGARAQGMITAFPSVTWPAHVTLVTGVPPNRHGVIGNNVYDRNLDRPLAYIGDPEVTKPNAIRVPTLYDAAHEAGLTTGAVIWPCCNGAATLDFMIPDSNRPDLHAKYTTPGFIDLLLKSNIDIRPIAEWGWDKQKANERDQLYTDVGCYLVQNQRVNLVLIHLIMPDGVEHDHGPYTPPVFESLAASDRRIRQVWDVLNQPPLVGKSTLFVVSDHGFAPYEKRVHPNVLLRRTSLIDVDAEGKVSGRRAWCVAQGGCSFAYVLGEQDHEQRAVALRRELSALEGVHQILDPQQFAELNVALPSENPQAPDFILLAGPGYAFTDNIEGEAVTDAGGLRGSHGHLPQPEYMQAMFVAAGTGIRPGTRLGVISSIDVAPTAAKLLGIELPTATGKALTEILED